MFAAHYLLYSLVVALILIPIALYFIKGVIKPAARGGFAIIAFPILVILWGIDPARSYYLRAVPLGNLDYLGLLAVITANILIITWGFFGLESKLWSGMLFIIPVDVALLILHSTLRKGTKQL